MQENIGDCFPSGYLANEIVRYSGDDFDEQTKRQLSVMADGKMTQVWRLCLEV